MNDTIIFSYYDRFPERVCLYCGKSRTRSEFADDVDINAIIDRFNRTGVLTDPFGKCSENLKKGAYFDTTLVNDFSATLERERCMRDEFARLPAKVRSRFDNDPLTMLHWLSDGSNADEAVKLGLLSEEDVTRTGSAQRTLDVTVPTDSIASATGSN